MFLPCPLCDSVYNDVSVVSCATNMEMKTEEHIRTVQCMYVYIGTFLFFGPGHQLHVPHYIDVHM